MPGGFSGGTAEFHIFQVSKIGPFLGVFLDPKNAKKREKRGFLGVFGDPRQNPPKTPKNSVFRPFCRFFPKKGPMSSSCFLFRKGRSKISVFDKGREKNRVFRPPPGGAEKPPFSPKKGVFACFGALRGQKTHPAP